MRLVSAFAQMKGAMGGLTRKELRLAEPKLEADGYDTMRQLGFSAEEIAEDDFPDDLLAETLYLIKHDPKEFHRRVQIARQTFLSNN